MKISKRKLDILFIFVIIFIMQTVSIACYRTDVLGEKDANNTDINIISNEDKNLNLSDEEKQIFKLVNQYREVNGLRFT